MTGGRNRKHERQGRFTNVNLDSHDALIVVDVQNDFCAGGRLAVEGADTIVPVLNRWIENAEQGGATVVVSRDWHPLHHVSFKERGGSWPEHCVQGTAGAAFHPRLELPDVAVLVSKGADVDEDNYSDFEDTELGELLRKIGVKRIWVGGLAQDICVRATVLDALAQGFETVLIPDATRPVNRKPDDGERAIEEMLEAGAQLAEDYA